TCDFRAAETARAGDADAFGAKTHRRLNGTLHCTAERHATLKLLGDRVGHKLGIDFGLAHFNDVDVHIRTGHRTDLLAELLDIRTLLADDDARTSRVNRDAALLVRTLDDDLRNSGLLQILHQLVADLHVLMKELAVLTLVREPARIPSAVDAEAKPDRIYFLTH